MHHVSRRILLPLCTALVLAAVPAISAQAKVLKVTGQSTTVTPSSAMTSFLTAHHITVAAVGPATISGGSLTLPITGGSVRTPKLNGRLVMAGGVRFTWKGQSVTLRRFVAARRGSNDVVTAIVGARRLTVARATGVHINVSGNTATITGELTLSAQAARMLNKLTGHKLVPAGADLGSFTSTVTVA